MSEASLASFEMPIKDAERNEPQSLADPLASQATVQATNTPETTEDVNGGKPLTSTLPTARSSLDEVLMEALRVPRDRLFILRQEKDIEDKIRNAQEDSWELPLMNSYQRLLIHRIADHFRLAHEIDGSTKAVTLSRQADTEIPESSLSSLAMMDMERLSESAYAMSKEVGGLSGNFKIMRREGRSDSPRNGQVQDENGLIRDRRNMTIEERETAYKEARSRIFGNEEASTGATSETSSVSTPLNEIDGKGLANLSLETEGSGKSETRKGTPGRVSPAPSSASSTSSAAFLRAGAPSFDPSARLPLGDAQWQQSYAYPSVDMSTQPYYYYPNGYGLPMLQHDINGRQVVANNGPVFLSPMYAYPHQDMYSSGGPSPSVSSRSTSVAGETEADGAHNTHLRGQIDYNTQMPGSSRGGNIGSGGNYLSRPQSLSPANSYQRGMTGINVTPHVYQGQVPVPASWNNQSIQSTQTGPQQMGYAAAVMGQGRSNIASSSRSSLSSAQSGSGVHNSHTGDPDTSAQDSELNGYGSRGRANPSERSLFDPSKPVNGSTSGNSNSSNSSSGLRPIPDASSGPSHHPLGKSVSAGVLDGRPALSDQRLTLPMNANLPVLNPDLNRRVSSSSSSNTSSADASRRPTPPTHPSLPARPNWVLPQRGRVSQLSNSSTSESSPANST